MISLKEISEYNFHACLELNASPSNTDFSDTVTYSLAEAWLYRDMADPLAIYCNDTIVGFVLLYTDVCHPQIINFMIDSHYQGMGYGQIAGQLCIEYLINNYNARSISLPVHPDNYPTKKLWEKLDFKVSDTVEDGYQFMRLSL